MVKDFLKGKKWPYIKAQLTLKNIFINPEIFSYYMPLISLLTQWKEKKIPLFLATGAHEKIAHAVAQHLNCFQDVWASTANLNLVGKRKAEHLKKKFGIYGFTYIGNSWRDLAIWRWSRDIVAVHHSSRFLVPYLKLWKKPCQNVVII
jgi:hypothetical protein